MFIYWPHNEITLIKVKSLKCNEPISLKKFYNDLGQRTTPHFCISVMDALRIHHVDKGQCALVFLQTYIHSKSCVVFKNSTILHDSLVTFELWILPSPSLQMGFQDRMVDRWILRWCYHPSLQHRTPCFFQGQVDGLLQSLFGMIATN